MKIYISKKDYEKLYSVGNDNYPEKYQLTAIYPEKGTQSFCGYTTHCKRPVEIKVLAEKLKQCGYPNAEADPEVIASRVINLGYRKQEPIIIPTPIESGCAILCDTEKVALNEFADKIIDLINSKADDFVVKDTYTKGKINGLRTAKMLIDELKKEYGVE